MFLVELIHMAPAFFAREAGKIFFLRAQREERKVDTKHRPYTAIVTKGCGFKGIFPPLNASQFHAGESEIA